MRHGRKGLGRHWRFGGFPKGSQAEMLAQNGGEMKLESLAGWTSAQKHTVTASYLAWSLDAFDFFVLTFVISELATQFSVKIVDVAVAVTLTLAFRPVGAFIFG